MSLILNRRVGEAIIINGDTRVELIKHNGKLALKVDAPRRVDVYREEVTKRSSFKREHPKHARGTDTFSAILAEMDMQSKGNVK